jgi:predicted nucleic acid-binding protein
MRRRLLSSKSYTMYPVTDAHFRDAWAMLKKHRDNEWSFTDCTSFIVMQELGMTFHLSFDEHFDQARFRAWEQ